jgi:hypothetical protein
MININCPDRDSKDDIENIISEKYSGEIKKILLRLKSKIITCYSDYSKIELNQRLAASTYSADEKTALQHTYSSQTTTAKKIIEAITKTQLITQAGCCVSCGIGEADQIDHFLPQEHFPEYSIMHKNLVPICGTCNEIKSDNIPGVTKDYFHPMFDKLPDEPFLNCQITYTSSIPISHFSVLPKFQTNIIGKHFNDLRLRTRLEKKATVYFLQITACKTEFGDTFAVEEIQRDISKLGVFYGTNYWKYILCEEMIKTNFIQQL